MSFVSGNWRSEMQRVAASQNDAFGEPITIIPCHRAPNKSAVPDHAHAITITGIFSWEARDGFLHKGRAFSDIPHVASRDPWVSFARACLPWALKIGDWIRRECDGTLWEVTKPLPDGVARVSFDLVQMGVPTP